MVNFTALNIPVDARKHTPTFETLPFPQFSLKKLENSKLRQAKLKHQIRVSSLVPLYEIHKMINLPASVKFYENKPKNCKTVIRQREITN
mgnify:CR=1 FL=1